MAVSKVVDARQPLIRQVNFDGACLCRRVRFNGCDLREIVYCHCGMCRRFHGTTAAYTAATKRGFEIADPGSLRWHAAAPGARRGFCAVCGSSLFWDPFVKPYICIAAGAIDGAVEMRPVRHVFVADKACYEDITDDLPRSDASMH